MEEIDIIELLKRVKEGNAPKKIEIDGTIYTWNNSNEDGDIDNMYTHLNMQCIDFWLTDSTITFDTKIKILDKPKIDKTKIGRLDFKTEKVPIGNGCTEEIITKPITTPQIIDKINEIIDYINKSEDK